MGCRPSFYPHGAIPASSVEYITNIFSADAVGPSGCFENCCQCQPKISYGIITTAMTIAQCDSLTHPFWGPASCFVSLDDGVTCLECGFPGPGTCLDTSHPDAFKVDGYTISNYEFLECSVIDGEGGCLEDPYCECCLPEDYYPEPLTE